MKWRVISPLKSMRGVLVVKEGDNSDEGAEAFGEGEVFLGGHCAEDADNEGVDQI